MGTVSKQGVESLFLTITGEDDLRKNDEEIQQG
jgi:hypothetical protein